jgi:hypothetical protein
MSGRALLICVACALLSACANDNNHPTSRPASVRERGEQALRDPANFEPEDPPTVSGKPGKGIDKKGIRRDWDRFWNP